MHVPRMVLDCTRFWAPDLQSRLPKRCRDRSDSTLDRSGRSVEITAVPEVFAGHGDGRWRLFENEARGFPSSFDSTLNLVSGFSGNASV
jgi:hypothetical protein